MKKYKIKDLTGGIYTLNKKELFDYIDDMIKLYHKSYRIDFKYICTDTITVNKRHGNFIYHGDEFEIKYYCKYRNEYFYRKKREIFYGSHFLEIKDIHGYSVDIDELSNDYDKSRKRCIKKSNKKRKKYSYNYLIPSGWRNEFSQNITAKESGIHVRAKRRKEIKVYLSKYYEKYTVKRIGKAESWKNKKIKKQYLKNKKAL